jgi:membrane protein YqaA with SNARE-associated domain
MSTAPLPGWLRRTLERSAGHRYYPLVLALIAWVSTTTFAFPFAIVLIPAVLLAPQRWLMIGLLCGLASGVGGAMLVEIFHFMGQELVIARFPQLLDSVSWQLASAWLQDYGLLALAIVAGSPMPQTPALFLYSLTAPASVGVLLAVGLGKTVKYIFLAWLTARYPARFIRYR